MTVTGIECPGSHSDLCRFDDQPVDGRTQLTLPGQRTVIADHDRFFGLFSVNDGSQIDVCRVDGQFGSQDFNRGGKGL